MLEEVQRIIDDQVKEAGELLKRKIDDLTGQAADEAAKLEDQIKAISNFQASMDDQVARLNSSVNREPTSVERAAKAQHTQPVQNGGLIRR